MAQNIKIEFDGTGDGVNDKGVHFIGPINDYTLCGMSMDGDTGTFGCFSFTHKKVNCDVCSKIVTFCKSIHSSHLKP